MFDRAFRQWRNGLLALGLLVLSHAAYAADLTGTWSFNVEIAGMGGGTATVTLSQSDGGNLTGTYAGQLGNTGITGTVDGKAFEFDVVGDMGTVTYTGELQEDGTVAGTLDLGGMASGTFVGTRQ